MNQNKKVGVLVFFFLLVLLVVYFISSNPQGTGSAIGNLLSGNVFTGNTVTTKTPSGSTVTKETPSTTGTTSSYLDGGPGQSTVFPDQDRGMQNPNYDDSVVIQPENRTWFPQDIGSHTNSPYGNPFNHLFPVDSTGKPTAPSSDVISYATTSAFGTLPPHGSYQDTYKYTDRPNMPQGSTSKPVGTTSAYGTLPAHGSYQNTYKYTDRPNMPAPSTKQAGHTSSAFGSLPSHSDQDWMYTDRPVI